jgi:excisionase family DNA binding protein
MEADGLLTPGEVATIFGVDPTTVSNWAKSGKLQAIRTLGGHRRFRVSEVRSVFRELHGGEDRGGRRAP